MYALQVDWLLCSHVTVSQAVACLQRIHVTEDSWPVSGVSDPLVLLLILSTTLRSTSQDNNTTLKKFNVGNMNRFSYC